MAERQPATETTEPGIDFDPEKVSDDRRQSEKDSEQAPESERPTDTTPEAGKAEASEATSDSEKREPDAADDKTGTAEAHEDPEKSEPAEVKPDQTSTVSHAFRPDRIVLGNLHGRCRRHHDCQRAGFHR